MEQSGRIEDLRGSYAASVYDQFARLGVGGEFNPTWFGPLGDMPSVERTEDPNFPSSLRDWYDEYL